MASLKLDSGHTDRIRYGHTFVNPGEVAVAGHHPTYAEEWDWDEDNESELAHHGIHVRDVYQVWANSPEWVPNKRRGSGDHKMLGLTDGGRALSIVVKYYRDRRMNRAITGWDATAGERTRYL